VALKFASCSQNSLVVHIYSKTQYHLIREGFKTPKRKNWREWRKIIINVKDNQVAVSGVWGIFIFKSKAKSSGFFATLPKERHPASFKINYAGIKFSSS